MILFLFSILLASCNKKNVNPDTGIEGMTLLWKKEYHKKGYVGTFTPLIYKDILVCGKYNEFASDTILGLNKADGKEVWRWYDFKGEERNLAGSQQYATVDNILAIGSNGEYTYGIDVSNGKLKYEIAGGQYNWRLVQSNNVFVRQKRLGDNEFSPLAEVRRVSDGKLLNTLFDGGEIQYKIRENMSDNTPKILADEITKDTIAYYLYVEFVEGGAFPKSDIFLAAYNISKKKMMYNNKITRDVAITSPVVMDKDRIFLHVFRRIICLDTKTGIILWEKELLKNNALAEHYANENIVVATADDGVFILDAKTGNILKEYKDKIIGGLGHTFTEYKGTIYFVAQGTGILFAFDAVTGERKWFLESPDKKIDSGYFFDRFVIDPTTDKMYIFNFKNLLCYQLPK